MNTAQLASYIFATHSEAEEATKLLGRSGFDIKKVSIIGKGYHSEEHPVGFYTTADKIKSWGGAGAFWGGLWGILFMPAVFFMPGFGLVAMAGPFVAVLVSALEGAIVVGGLSALGAAFSQLGVAKDQVLKYELAVKADQFVMLIHGSRDDLQSVDSILSKYSAQKSNSFDL